MKLTRIVSALVLPLALGLVSASCHKKGSKSSGSSTTSSGTKNTDGTTTDSNGITHDPADDGKPHASSSGAATATTNDPGTLALNLGLVDSVSRKFGLLDDDPCANGSVTATKFGYPQNEIFAKGDMTNYVWNLADMPQGDDMIVNVTCSDGSKLLCATKPGGKGEICNKVTTSLITAFLTALNKGLDDPSFKGKPIAQVVAGIAKAATIPSATNDDFKAKLAACTDGPCYHDTILASPFAGSFVLMQALAGNWTPESIITFVTDTLGVKIRIDDQLYSDIMTTLDDAITDVPAGTTAPQAFVAPLRTLIADVIDQQQKKTSTYAFLITCSMNVNGVETRFDPTMVNGQASCSKDQESDILKNIGFSQSDISAIISPDYRGSPDGYSCTAPNANNGKCYVEPASMVAVAVASEVNRNDVDGTHGGDHGWTPEMGIIDVMDPVMRDLQAANIQFGPNGGPQIDDSNKEAFKGVIKQDKKFFLGLIGIYLFLNDTTENGIKLSLQNLHDIFTGDKFMRERVSGWGMTFTGAQVQVPNRGSQFVPAMLTFDTTVNGYTFDPVFAWSPSPNGGGGGMQGTTIDMTKYAALYNATVPRIDDTFGRFTSVPTQEQISDYIFNASQHQDWNPMGSKYIGVAEYNTSGMPIACKLDSYAPGPALKDGSSVTCDTTYTGVTCDSFGSCAFPSGYAYPYVLSERGWYGDDVGRLFVLTSRQDGRPVGPNGGIYIKEYKSGNAAGACDASEIGKVIDYTEQTWCGPNVKCEQKMTAYCMDMSTLGSPARRRFYPGGTYTVINTDPNGNRNQWDVPQIGAHVPNTDHSSDYPVCLYVPSGSLIDSQAFLATHHLDASGYIQIAGITGAAVKNCSNAAGASETKYILYQWSDFGANDTMWAMLLDPGNNNQQLMFANPPIGPVPANYDWSQNNVKLKETDINTLLGSGITVAGSAATQINHMNYVNPSWDQKFDPYCDDRNGNGGCDCYAVKTISPDRRTFTYEDTVRPDPSQCGLLDKAAEPSLSQLPYCANCQNSADTNAFFKKYGGKSGADLANAASEFQSKNLMFDVNSALNCLYHFKDETNYRSPNGFDWMHWESDANGCAPSEGATRSDSSKGPMRLINPRPMNNTFLIDRPQTLLKVINYAFKTVGTGVTLDLGTPYFSPDEAAAMLILAQKLPLEHAVYDNNGTQDKNASIFWQAVQDPSSGSVDVVTALLKGTLKIGNVITQDDLDYVSPDHNH